MTERTHAGSGATRRPAVAFVGLGAMGQPMCRRLLGTHDVTIFDVVPRRVRDLAAAGARTAASPAAAARHADIAVLAVRDGEQLESALHGPDGIMTTLRAGATVVLTSTVGPEVARETAARLAARQVALVDAPVSGGPERARGGDLVIMVGAASDALSRCRSVLDRIGSVVARIGPRPGDGQAMKAVNQLLCGVHIAAAAEAVALAQSLGLDPRMTLDVLGQGAAASFMLADRGPRMISTEGRPDPVRSRLDIFVKDMGIVTGIARRAGVPTPVAAAAEQLYLLGRRQGLGGEDDSSIITVITPPPDGTDNGGAG